MRRWLVFFLILISCSKEEKTAEQGVENSEKDPIIGSWQLLRTVLYYNDGREEEIIYSECEKSGRTIFEISGEILESTFYLKEGDCIQRESSSFDQRWLNLAEEKYRFEVTYYNENEELETEYLFPDRVWFPEEGIMKMNPQPEADIKFYFHEYKRIN